MNKIYALASRNAKIFLRDRAAVFFSFLAVFIVFVLYLLFISTSITSGIKASITANGFQVSDKLAKLFSDSWMMSGVMGIGCITVANGCLVNFVNDTALDKRRDFFVTPTKKTSIILSYFFSTILITFSMNTVIFFIVYIYLLIIGMGALSFGAIMAMIGLILLTSISSTMMMLSIALFLKTESAHGAVVAIASVVTGFATGAYMPMKLFPKILRDIFAFVPATGSVVMMRKIMMKPALQAMKSEYPAQLVDILADEFSLELVVGSWTVPDWAMLIYHVICSLLFLGIIAFAVKKKLK